MSNDNIGIAHFQKLHTKVRKSIISIPALPSAWAHAELHWLLRQPTSIGKSLPIDVEPSLYQWAFRAAQAGAKTVP